MSSSDSDIVATIKESADIVELIGESVDLRKSGASYLGLCPFHGEKTPSFSVSPDKQFFHCFGCGESGDIFDFMMKSQGVDFPEALRLLGARYGIAVPERRQSRQEREKRKRREALFAVTKQAAELFESYLYQGRASAAAHAYLRKRGVSGDVARRFKLGYAPSPAAEGWNYLGSRLSEQETAAALETGLLVAGKKGGNYDRFRDRIVFPIYTLSGEICGFGGRIVGQGQPKYLNSPESLIYNKSSLLLGLYQAKQQIRAVDRAIVVEGNFDMISLAAAGCENVVAPLGTALTREQLRYIKRFTDNVTLLFDGDAAGEKAAVRAVPLFLVEQMAARIALLPDGHDPDSYIRKYGLPELMNLLEQAKNLPEFVIDRLVAAHSLGFDGKMKIINELKPLFKAASTSMQRSLFIAHFAEKLGLPKEELQELMNTTLAKEGARHVDEPPMPPDELGPVVTKPKSQQEYGLNRMQWQMLEFAVFNPEHFPDLCAAGLREIFVDSPGEAIIDAFEALLDNTSLAEPEDLLTSIVDEAERKIVTKLLLAPRQQAQKQEPDEVIRILGEARLLVCRNRIKEQVALAEAADDSDRLRQLLAELMAINKQIQHGREQVARGIVPGAYPGMKSC